MSTPPVLPAKDRGLQAAASFRVGPSTLELVLCSSQPCTTRMPTPHPSMHRAHALQPGQLGTARSTRDRGASLMLLSPISACIPRSFTCPGCLRCCLALVCTARRLSTSGRTQWHASPRHGACLKVRPSPCHASKLPLDHAQPLSHTTTQLSTTAPLSTYSFV